MEIVSYTGYQSKTKRVVIEDVSQATDDEIIDFALREARETRSSIFSVRVSRNEFVDTALVEIGVD